MNVVRFSAVKNFGVPIDNPEALGTTPNVVALMAAYSIEGEEVGEELTDITPYYWKNPVFRYYLSRKSVDGPAVVEIMPRHHDSTTHAVGTDSKGELFAVETNMRTIEIPTFQEAMVVAGPGPRFAGQVCIHELIAVV